MKLDDLADDTEAADLTERQAEVLGFISHCIEDRRLPPTRKEIAKHFGFTHSAAADHVMRLAKHGVIVVIPGSSRGIMLPDRC